MTPWTVACQAAVSMGFSRPDYWSGLPRPSPGDLPDPGSKPRSPVLQADSLPSEPPGSPNEAEVDIFMELPCFLHNSTNVSNLTSGPSASSKTQVAHMEFLGLCTVEA